MTGMRERIEEVMDWLANAYGPGWEKGPDISVRLIRDRLVPTCY